MHEDQHLVSIDAEAVTVQNPSGELNQLLWKDVLGISIETNDSGPFGSDAWWYVSGAEGSVVFPLGATGEPETLAYFQKLPGFKDEVLIQAMSSTNEAMFILWQKDAEA